MTHFILKKRAMHLAMALVLLAAAVTGCQTIKEIASLRNVRFSLGQLTDVDLAGVRLDNIRSYSDIAPRDVLKLTGALATGKAPLQFVLHVNAENPADNQVAARLVRMDWTLFLEDRETISGALEQELVLQPGQPADIPVGIQLDLLQFFNDNVRDLVELASSLQGQGGAAKNVKLVATPIVETIIGPIRYPQPITIVNETIGG